RALARSGRVLEINTKTPLASVDLVRWWRDEGGTAGSFGRDAHPPQRGGGRVQPARGVGAAGGLPGGPHPAVPVGCWPPAGGPPPGDPPHGGLRAPIPPREGCAPHTPAGGLRAPHTPAGGLRPP